MALCTYPCLSSMNVKALSVINVGQHSCQMNIHSAQKTGQSAADEHIIETSVRSNGTKGLVTISSLLSALQAIMLQDLISRLQIGIGNGGQLCGI